MLEDATLQPLSGQPGEAPFYGINLEAEAGLKWKWNLGCRSGQARLGCFLQGRVRRHGGQMCVTETMSG